MGVTFSHVMTALYRCQHRWVINRGSAIELDRLPFRFKVYRNRLQPLESMQPTNENVNLKFKVRHLIDACDLYIEYRL